MAAHCALRLVANAHSSLLAPAVATCSMTPQPAPACHWEYTDCMVRGPGKQSFISCSPTSRTVHPAARTAHRHAAQHDPGSRAHGHNGRDAANGRTGVGKQVRTVLSPM